MGDGGGWGQTPAGRAGRPPRGVDPCVCCTPPAPHAAARLPPELGGRTVPMPARRQQGAEGQALLSQLLEVSCGARAGKRLVGG